MDLCRACPVRKRAAYRSSPGPRWALSQNRDDYLARLYLGLVLAKGEDRGRGLSEIESGMKSIYDHLEHINYYTYYGKFGTRGERYVARSRAVSK